MRSRLLPDSPGATDLFNELTKEVVGMLTDHEGLRIDAQREADRLCAFIRDQVLSKYKRKGVVVGLSGGIDSAVMASVCVRALGAERVCGLILPERESASESLTLAARQAERLDIRTEIVDITPLLEAFGVYARRDAVVREFDGDFDSTKDAFRVTLPPDLLNRDALNVFALEIRSTRGRTSHRLKAHQLRAIVAAQNIKQRTRMIELYHFAEKLHYVVGGTTNRTELDQGFFVKYGDGGVDIEPLAHLYKTQVYQLAEHLGVIEEIRSRAPSPDTWPGGVTDEEFYFRMPIETLDTLLFAWNQGIPAHEVASSLNLSPEQVDRAFRDFTGKRDTTWHLRALPPSLVAETSAQSFPAGSNGTVES